MNSRDWRFIEFRRGTGAPRVTIIGCTHGDELTGERVVNALKQVPLLHGSLSLIIAHPLARARGKRFIEQDLNRSFPGKRRGCLEERLAFELRQRLSSSDFVIDIHATNSRIDSIAIVTKLTPVIRRVLEWLPVKRIALVEHRVFGGQELIGHVKAGIAMEYGAEKSGRNYRRALGHVRALLRNLSMIAGLRTQSPEKVLYRISGQYRVPRGFKEASGLRDFQLIRKGQLIGRVGLRKIYAIETFSPLFLGNGRYHRTLCLIAQRKRYIITAKLSKEKRRRL